MILNYFKTAYRNLWKNKSYSAINILGLAMGLACSMLIMLWVNDEKKVDRFHKNGEQLYCVFERQYYDGQVEAGYSTPGVIADEMKRVLPEVQYATNYGWGDLNSFAANDKILKERGNYAGQDFFKMFSYPLLQGNAITALQSPLDITISKKMAEDFFGSPEEAMGKTIRYEDRKDLKVTAVFDNVPQNSSTKFDFIINWQTFLENNRWAKEWTNNGPPAFVMLRKGADALAFEKKITRFLDKYNTEQTKNNYIRLGIQKYEDQYLNSNFKNGELSGGRIQYVRLFSIVAVLILLIACINFMNLTTARSVKRAREIGVRKVIGALRSSLIRQFIGEALLVVTLAVIISLLIVTFVLPRFNELTGKQIELPWGNTSFWFSITGLLLVTGFISGSYPALYLSSFNPVRVLKGTLKFSNSALWFRKGLVVFQFVLSITLIVGTLVISRQVNYIQSLNLGYNRENLIYIPVEGDLRKKYDLLKSKALTLPGVKLVTRMTQSPTGIDNGTSGVEWEGKDPNTVIEFTQAAVGYDFLKTMHASIAQGRDFSKEFATDSAGYLINEAALKRIGYKDPIGKPLTFWQKKGTIIGVIKDFHFNSVHTAIKPLVIRLDEEMTWGVVLIRTEPGKTKEALAGLEKICKDLNPKFPFTYQFSDEEYRKLYQSEQVVDQLSNYFAFLAIAISCLGLLGLVIFTAEQRTKEFGIRKVLGAGSATLFSLLSREFVYLVLIALLISIPVSWVAMNQWLQNFEYHVKVSWWIFLFAGLLSLLIALITISFQAIKAANTNPVKSLRTE